MESLRVNWRREAERHKSLSVSFDVLLKVVDALNAFDGVSASVRPPCRSQRICR